MPMRIALGCARGGMDFIYGDAFPHEADMDQLHGVDSNKGCYIGQEVVSRIEHRGSARNRNRVIRRRRRFAPTPACPWSRASVRSALPARRPGRAASPCCGSIASPKRWRPAPHHGGRHCDPRRCCPSGRKFSWPKDKAAE